MEKTYQPEHIEKQCYQHWESAGYFKPSGKGEPYCIMLPPPNVTGTLHMGHGFQISLMDALIRYHRMRGFNTLWQVGTDHAGISTQIVVEQQLAKEGKTRRELGRDAFLKRIWEWKGQSDGTIKQQLRHMGASMDWSRERFSLDHGICDAVKQDFVQLYDEGLIYRGKRLVNWDPALQTAISDLEVVSEEEDGFLWHIRYPLEDSNNYLIVATTRPETMLGDTAVAVHPDDARYQHLIGKQVQLPLTDRTIPIVSDTYVDKEFGTGCVKITPAHDFNDNAVGQRHNLPMINIFTADAHINDNAPQAYRGLDRYAARKKIIADLEALNLLEKTEPHKLQVPHGEKSGAVIEPYLTDQWFMKTKSLAQPAIEAVRKGKIKFVPATWTKTYFQWLENIEDWCISRQLWWGHRIPAWYDEQGNVYVGFDEAQVREKYHLNDSISLGQDEDVLDTWFSSALWPFATLGWPQLTPELETFYPTSVLVTGFDIIFFWVARMVMMGLKFTANIPFHTVYITGLIRDSDGKKMSKSKGNTLDPLDLIQGISLEDLVTKRTRNLMLPSLAKKIAANTRKEFPQGIPAFGTDALRFTYCALASTGRDIRFDLGRIAGYRNFCNKLWNATRYVLMNCKDQDTGLTEKAVKYSLADRWIRAKLQDTIKQVDQAFKTYRFDILAQCLYEFTWNEYCDWYLELSKPMLTTNTTSGALLRGTRQTLVQVLETLLRLIHPLMPFITEVTWQQIAPLAGKQNDSIMMQSYPEEDAGEHDEAAVKEIEWLKQVISSVRSIRSEMNISPAKTLPLLLNKGTEQDRQRFQVHEEFISQLAKLDSIRWLEKMEQPPPAATALVNKLELLIPMAGLIDKNAEMERLTKEISKLQKDLLKSEQKLKNPNYVNKAPADVVNKEQERAKSLQTTITKLDAQLNRIKAL